MPKYPGFRIRTIHAICAIGDDDEEGVCSHGNMFSQLPLIAANEERLYMIKELAQQVADETGQTFKVVRFSVREDIGEIVSRKLS